MGGPSGNGGNGGNPGNKNRFNPETGRENVDRKNPGGYNFGREGDNTGGRQPTKPKPKPKPKSVEQPKVAAQMDNTNVKSDLITADKIAPTTVEMDNEIALKNKKKGRKATVLTSVTGVEGYPTLSKKTLLGG